MENKKKVELEPNPQTNQLIFLLVFFLISTILIFLCQYNNKINVQILAHLNANMSNPNLIKIKTKKQNNKMMENQYLIIDNNNKDNVRLFYPQNNEINKIPKSNLSGNFQQYLPLIHTPNKFINVNVIKSSNNDVTGIDIFDINTNSWKKLKTKPILRDAKNPPSIDIIYTKDKTPVLIIWGKEAYISKKIQNTIEIIDILNDKLLERKEANFEGGKIFQIDNNYYLIGSEKFNNKPIFFQEETIDVIEPVIKNPIVFDYFKLYENALSSSLDRLTILAINPVEKKLYEHEIVNSADNLFKTSLINIPLQYKNYSLINSLNTHKGILLIFKNDRHQLLVLFKNTENTRKGQNYRFKLLKKVNLDFDLTNAQYLETDLANEQCLKFSDDQYTLIGTNRNKIIKIVIK